MGWEGIELSGVTYDVVGDESAESSSEVYILEAAWSSRFERGEDLLFLENRPPKNGIGWKKVVASEVWHLECLSQNGCQIALPQATRVRINGRRDALSLPTT